jgi:hypothetical protein
MFHSESAAPGDRAVVALWTSLRRSSAMLTPSRRARSARKSTCDFGREIWRRCIAVVMVM